MTLVHLNRFH